MAERNKLPSSLNYLFTREIKDVEMGNPPLPPFFNFYNPQERQNELSIAVEQSMNKIQEDVGNELKEHFSTSAGFHGGEETGNEGAVKNTIRLPTKNHDHKHAGNSVYECVHKFLKMMYKQLMTDKVSKQFCQHLFLEVELRLEEFHKLSIDELWDTFGCHLLIFRGQQHQQHVWSDWVTSISISCPKESYRLAIEAENGRRRELLEDMKTDFAKEVYGKADTWLEHTIDLQIPDEEKQTAEDAMKQNLEQFCTNYAKEKGEKDSALRKLLFNTIINEPMIEDFLENLKTIETMIRSFRRDTEDKLKRNRYLGPKQFHGLIEGEIWNSTVRDYSFSDKKFLALLEKALDFLCDQYRDGNKFILQQEENIANTVFLNMEGFYQKLMKACTTNFLVPQLLNEIHEIVAKAILKGFRKCLDHEGHQGGGPEDSPLHVHLANNLGIQFEKFKRSHWMDIAEKINHVYMHQQSRRESTGPESSGFYSMQVPESLHETGTDRGEEVLLPPNAKKQLHDLVNIVKEEMRTRELAEVANRVLPYVIKKAEILLEDPNASETALFAKITHLDSLRNKYLKPKQNTVIDQ